MPITANQPFGDWGKVFPNPAMTLAAVATNVSVPPPRDKQAAARPVASVTDIRSPPPSAKRHARHARHATPRHAMPCHAMPYDSVRFHPV